MMTKIKALFGCPWMVFLGAWIVALIGILFPSFAEWPIIPVVFLALIPGLYKAAGKFNAIPFLNMVLGGLSIQILFWL